MKKVSKKRPRFGRKQRIRALEFKILEGVALLGLVGIIVAAFVFSATIERLVMHSGQGAAVISSVLVDLANGDRGAHSLGTLKINPVLEKAAQAKADDMAAKGYFAHTSPEGKDSWHWFKQAGYNFVHAGENLAVDFSDSGEVEKAWMNSPTHRANIVNPNYTEVGIAIAYGFYQGHPTTYVVQMFGTPTDTAAAITQTNVPTNASQPATATTEPLAGEPAEPNNVLGSAAGASEGKTQTTPVKPSPKTLIDAADTEAPMGAVKATQGESVPVKYAPAWGYAATSPKTMLLYVYYAIGIFVMLALAIDTGLEIRWHHRRRAVRAGALLVVMGTLFFVADVLFFSEPVLAAIGSSL